jgi:hypothetical protein
MKFLALALITSISLGTLQSCAQSNPFTGSNNLVTKTYSDTGFNKISFENLDGEIDVVAGATYTISTTIKEKYAGILEVKNENGVLKVKLNYAYKIARFVRETGLKVKITCPTLQVVSHGGNSNLNMSLLNQDTTTFNNSGNGSCTFKGKLKWLALNNSGNGAVAATDLEVINLKVNSSGNSKLSFAGKAIDMVIANSGNGNIEAENLAVVNVIATNSGNGDITLNSAANLTKVNSGNGQIKIK